MRRNWKAAAVVLTCTAMLAAVPAFAGEDKVITFWDACTGEADAQIIGRAIDAFNENNEWGYTIEESAFEPDAYKEKIHIAMSSGECPDMWTSWSGGTTNEYIDAGYGQPLDELFEKASWKDNVLDGDIEQAKHNGKLYGIGWLNVSVSGVYYNKEMFEEYGLEVPKTISEFEAVCDTLLENGIIPISLANVEKWTGSQIFMNLATRKGGNEPFKAAADGTGTFEDEAFVYAGEKIQEWVNKGYFPEGVNSLSEADGQSRQLLYTDQAAMIVIGSWDHSTFLAEYPEFYEKAGWFPFPAVDDSDVDASIMIGTLGDSFIHFNCEGEKLEAAFTLFDYLFEDEAIAAATNLGKLVPVKNAADYIPEDQVLTKQILEAVAAASDVQLWYDQYLPPTVTQAHLNTCQELFGLTMTPEEAAAVLQQAEEDYQAEQ